MIAALILLSLVIISGGYIWVKNKKQQTNHQSSKLEPTLDKESSVDADEVLGIKTVASPEETEKAQNDTPSKPTAPEPTPVILYLMAPSNSTFGGYELLQALLSAGLRFGEQQVFHRHEHKDGRGKTLFHCASAESPGTFDLSKMGSFSTRGLCLFFNTEAVSQPLSTFDILLETIDQLIDDLGGAVFDAKHQPFNKEKMVQYRQWIRNIEESMTTQDMFAQA